MSTTDVLIAMLSADLRGSHGPVRAAPATGAAAVAAAEPPELAELAAGSTTALPAARDPAGARDAAGGCDSTDGRDATRARAARAPDGASAPAAPDGRVAPCATDARAAAAPTGAQTASVSPAHPGAHSTWLAGAPVASRAGGDHADPSISDGSGGERAPAAPAAAAGAPDAPEDPDRPDAEGEPDPASMDGPPAIARRMGTSPGLSELLEPDDLPAPRDLDPSELGEVARRLDLPERLRTFGAGEPAESLRALCEQLELAELDELDELTTLLEHLEPPRL